LRGSSSESATAWRGTKLSSRQSLSTDHDRSALGWKGSWGGPPDSGGWIADFRTRCWLRAWMGELRLVGYDVQ
jgi:hypothetical protein